MSHHHHDHAVEVDPRQVENAVQGWISFTNLMKYSILAAVVIMALLALTLVNW